MKKPVASARPNCSVVLDRRNGEKYHVYNRSIVTHENRETGETKHLIVDRFTRSGEMVTNVWELAKRQYRRAIRIFRQEIDLVLATMYRDIPKYRDCDVSTYISVIRTMQGTNIEKVALAIFEMIQKNKDDK